MKREHGLSEKEMELVKLLMADCHSTGDIQSILKRLFAGTIEQITSTAMAVAISLTAFAGLQLQKQSVLLKATAADFSYPVQKFRMGISDTDCNINISGTADGDYLNGWTINGTDNEKWYLNLRSEQGSGSRQVHLDQYPFRKLVGRRI